jgi:macrolide-specific efflux system membrane fusion protein
MFGIISVDLAHQHAKNIDMTDKERKNRADWVIFASIAALCMSLIACSERQGEPAPQSIVSAATLGDIERVVTAAGTLEAGAYVDVGAQVSGQLETLLVQIGQQVTEGELLATIDARVQVNRVAASRANLKADEAQMSARKAALDLARANVRRQRELVQDDLTTKENLDKAINSLAAAESALVELESRIARSKAGLASDEAQLGYSKIYAPAGGTVVSISTIEGQTINASQYVPTILRIANLDTMTVKADVSEADVTSISEGTEVYFTTLGGGDRRWYGTVKQIQPTPNVIDNVVSYPVLFDVDNADGSLLPGMTTQVFFIVEAVRDVLTVPLSAVSFDTGAQGATVQVVDEVGKVATRNIEVGMVNRIAAQVISGLSPGERVIAGSLEQ